MGQDQPRAGLPRRHRLPRPCWPHGPAQRAALQPRRLWLHDVHRQLGPAARGPRRRHLRARARRWRRPVGQPQLRGSRASQGACRVPRLAPARRRVRARRHAQHRSHVGADRYRQRGQRRDARRHLAVDGGDQGGHRRVADRGSLREGVRRDLGRRRALARPRGPDRPDDGLGRRLDVRAPAAVLLRHGRRAARPHGHRRHACPGRTRRLDHDRPHLPRRRDPARRSRRPLAARARCRAARVQLVRRAPRQPRGDGARHVREHPPAQRACPRHGGRPDRVPAVGRGHVDLRRI